MLLLTIFSKTCWSINIILHVPSRYGQRAFHLNNTEELNLTYVSVIQLQGNGFRYNHTYICDVPATSLLKYTFIPTLTIRFQLKDSLKELHHCATRSNSYV
jgi:hypothetical protein